MKQDELLRLFPNASASTIAANAQGSRTAPKLERPLGNAALGQGKGEEKDSGRVHLRIVSVRKRLLDPDNLSPKWTIDALRYCGIIRGDEPEKITLEVTQRKAAKTEAEHTVIEIYSIPCHPSP